MREPSSPTTLTSAVILLYPEGKSSSFKEKVRLNENTTVLSDIILPSTTSKPTPPSGILASNSSIQLLGFTLSNCIDEFDAKIPDGGVGLLVVEGNIISDSTVVFSLSRTFSLNEDDLPSGYNKITADVSVVGEDGSRIAGTSIGDGVGEVRRTAEELV